MSSETPPVSAASQAGVLRRAWLDVAANAAPQLADLPALLDQRLSDLEGAGALDEASLLAVAEEASQYALEQGAGEVARALSKRLRRAIYEFLLALDAVNPAEMANAPALTAPPAAPSAEPRTPVAFTPADVPGADEPTAVLPPPPAPVPLWEAVAPPPRVREVYRVATPGVDTAEEPAPAEAVSEPVVEEPAVDEMGAEPHAVAAEFADVESGAEAAEAQVVEAEAHAGEVVDALAAADQAEADVAEAAAARAAFEAEQANAADAAEGSDPFAAVHPLTNGNGAGAPHEAAAATATEWTEAAHAAEAPQWSVATSAVEAATDAQWTATPAQEWAETSGTAAAAGDTEAPAADHAAAPDATLAAEYTATPEAPAAEHATAPDAAAATEYAVAPGEPHAAAAAPADTETHPAEPAAESTAESTEPDSWQAPIVELPVQPAGEPAAWEPAAHADAPPAADAPQLHVLQPDAAPAPPANGAKPPRELLRVPRQFRRLPPLAQRHGNGSTPHTPVEEPAGALPPVTPEPEATDLDDDTLGVPAVPWMLAQPPAPDPEPEPPAPQAEEPEHADDDMGVPFGPFAFAGDDADLPRPPALAEEPLHPLPSAAPAADLFIQPLPGNDAPQLWTPGPVPTPDYALPRQPAAEPFPIAPLEGFHLTDPGALELDPAAANPFLTQPDVPAAVPPAPPAPAAPEQSAPQQPAMHDAHAGDDGAWRVRQSPRAQLLAERMAQKRREEAARAAFEAASFHDDDRDHRHGRRRGRQEEALPDLPTARRQLDEHLRKKRGAEAGALLQRLAQELGGRDIADLALDSGDRCRALGQSRSATNCYLAAWRADPLYETPLWRLSDVCLNDQEIDLAVGYLERIAELMRSRGDDEGAIGVYRKIAMIAPERQDVRDVIRLAKTTGRLDG